MEYIYAEYIDETRIDYKVTQKGSMWVVEDSNGRVAFGKTVNKAFDNLMGFVEKEERFNKQHCR